jgi:hypothetical protein
MSAVRARRIAIATGALALVVAFLGWRAPAPTPALPGRPASPPAGAALDPTRFLAEARLATVRYDSLQHAIDDGFTRVGSEFPAMGEHWVSFTRVMENTFDARRPSVLIYASTVDGPRLAGVAYSRLIGADVAPPAFPFVGAWHEHNGTVSEESLPTGHAAHMPSMQDASHLPADSLRFLILHAWIRAANPAGPFATDNWTLPLLRVGLDPESSLPHATIRGLALVADERDYHYEVLSTALALSPPDDSVLAGIVRSRRTRLGGELALIRHNRSVSPRQSAMLEATWDSLWADLRRVFPSRRNDLERLRALM